MIDVKNLSFQFSDGTVVFEFINFKISEGCIGIFGDNGVGKTTLLNLLSGTLPLQNGTIHLDGQVEFVEQFDELQASRSPGELQLARLKQSIFTNPDILLLDEPTSNLDKNGIKVLTGLIKHFEGIVLVVSHDVDFLDSITEKMLLIENQKVKLYEKKFCDFQRSYEQERQKRLQLFEVQNKQKKQQRKSIQRIREKHQRSKRAKSISNSDKKAKGLSGKYDKVQNRLANAEKKIRKTLNDSHTDLKPFSKMGLKVLDSGQIPKKVEIQVSFFNLKIKDKILANDPFQIPIRSGHVLALVGNNGVGKSTLLNKLSQKLLAKNIRVSYFHQNITKNWHQTQPLITQLIKKSGNRKEVILEVAGALGVNQQLINRKPGELSGGQLLKVQLILSLVSEFDVLILDEPTNYLDYDGVDALTKYINNSKAAIVIVSHDKTFLENVTSDTVVFENRRVISFLTLNDYFKE